MVELNQQILLLKIEMEKTATEIGKIENKADLLLGWYKLVVIIITLAHLVSFTYMIFFVDWLGWDIIEPLTFTVGTIYLFLAMRFYRKFHADRTPLSIRDRFRHFALRPSSRISLNTLKNRLKQQKENYAKIITQKQLNVNRLAQDTSLVHLLL